LQKKTIIPLIAFISLIVGFSSAKVYEILKPKGTNIFDKTRGETPGIVWVSDTAMQAYPFRVEGDLTFAGEHVPLHEPDVQERLDRELQINIFRQSNTILDMKLANRYFPDIERILIEEGVPTDFKYLPLIESDFRDVVSPAGAAGFWQFLPGTAKMFGLEISDQVDERYNVEKATRAACQYIKDAKEKLGSWTAAAAAYNYGTEGIATKLESQHTTSYYDLSIANETARYVFRMLAMKVIFASPEKAGYHIHTEDLYQSFKYNVIQVDSTVSDIASFSEMYGIKYKEMKLLNPWMRNSSLPNKSHKPYLVKIMTR
jgi:hypothetical protein